MSTSTLDLFLRHLALSEEVGRLGPASDHDLLMAYETTHGQAAFTELMRRYGPMVLRACRRVLGRGSDAEDACQATFVMLARKAGQLRRETVRPLSLGGWLHRVAYRTAADVLTGKLRREAHERRASAMTSADSDPSTEATWNEIRPILDAELDALPDDARRLLIACYLQEKTHAEAAAELGVPLGSVAWRLERARALLAGRLARRGITVSAALLAVLLERTARAAGLPAVLMVHTVEVARQFTDQAVSVLSANVARLVKGGLARLGKSWMPQASMVLMGSLGLLGAGLIVCQTLKVWPAQPPWSETSLQRPVQDGKPAPAPGEKPGRPESARLDLFGAPLPDHAVARMGMSRLRHLATVSAVAYAPDGKTIASASWDKTLCLWDAATGKELRRLDGHHEPLTAVVHAPDGRTLASGGADKAVRLWDAATGKELRCLKGHDQLVSAIAFSPSGKQLISGSWDQSVCLWDVAGGRQLRRFTGHTGRVWSVAFSTDGQTAASAGADGTVRIWNTRSGKETHKLEGHEGGVVGLAFSPNGKTLASGDAEGAIRLWEVATGRQVRKLQVPTTPGQPLRGVSALAFTPDGRNLVSGSQDWTIRFWDMDNGTEVRSLKAHFGRYAHLGQVLTLAFSRDGKSLVSGGTDEAVRHWDLATGKQINNWEGHREYISSIIFSPDGKTVASASHDNTVRLWDPATGKQLRQLDGLPEAVFHAVVFSPDGKTLATCGSDLGKDRGIRLWDTASGKEVRRLLGRTDHVASMAMFSPDGKTLVSTGIDKTIRRWNPSTGEELSVWKTRVRVAALAFSPDGKLLALAEWGNSITLCDAATGRAIGELPGYRDKVNSVAFSPDGKTLASAGFDGTVRLWDVTVPDKARELRRLKGHQYTVRCVAFAPGGRHVASGGSDGTVRLWEVVSGKECARFTGHDGSVLSVAFSPDGRRLASASQDHTVLIWDLTGQTGKAAARLRANDLDRLWSDLASDDAARAYRAGCVLAAVPDRAVNLLRRHLRRALEPADPLRLVVGQEGANDSVLEPEEPVKTLLAEDLRIVRAAAVLEEIATARARELSRELSERVRQAQKNLDHELGRRP
jgi:RNA polymerase sigma factor (sigma-70 family)